MNANDLTIYELVKKRRAGASFNELISNILNTPRLFKEFTFLDILINVGFSKDLGHLDFSSEDWADLPAHKQIEYSMDYQKWYALQLGVPAVKMFPINDAVGIDLMLIPPGTYTRKNGRDYQGFYYDVSDRVTFEAPFWCQKYKMCQRIWESVMVSNPSRFLGLTNPVECVTQRMCAIFCEKANCSLLTSKEWQYVCRAGTTTNYSFGNTYHQLKDYAWYNKNSGGQTHPIGQKLPNAWGLYDMHGNVFEWTKDLLTKNSHEYTLCGSSFMCDESRCRSSFMDHEDRDSSGSDVGFRVCLKI